MQERDIERIQMSKPESVPAGEAFGSLEEVIDLTHEVLEAKGWDARECSACGSSYYRKTRSEVKTCNSYKCGEGYKFLEIARRRKNIQEDEVLDNLKNIFLESGFTLAEPVNVKDGSGSTVFIGNAGQVFDGQIFKELPVEGVNPALIFQPAIRLQGQGLVGQLDGMTTSFINVATEQLNVSPEAHIKTFDRWLDFLSGLGIYAGHLTLKPKLEVACWGRIEGVTTHTLKLNYLGLELGVSNYAQIPQTTREPISQSDITFGLERAMWAVNKNSRFYEVVGPLENALRNEDEYMDAYRTTTLMAASGVRPSVDEQGSKMRVLMQKYPISEHDFNPDLVSFYYNWWAKYANFSVSREHATAVLRDELMRMDNVQKTQMLQNGGKLGVRIDTGTRDLRQFLNSDQIDILRRRRDK